MVGPSSSHTAGALRIALVARSLGPYPMARVEFTLYNSFARTYRGHGSDRALVAGILGLSPDDERVRDSFELAREAGLDFTFVPAPDEAGAGRHPNTVRIDMVGADGREVSVTGESLGGGRVRICAVNDVEVELTGDYPTLFITHPDQPGALAQITGILSASGVNIATINTFRERRGGTAYTVVESDERVPDFTLELLDSQLLVEQATRVDVPGAANITPDTTLGLDFNTGADLLALCSKEGLSIGALMRRREIELLGDERLVDSRMNRVLEVMRAETSEPLEHPRPSLGGLIGGQAQAVAQGDARLRTSLMGETLTRAAAYSMATLERSASMGVIVAAPTAGSAGVVPGAVLSVAEALDATDTQVCEALWCAAARHRRRHGRRRGRPALRGLPCRRALRRVDHHRQPARSRLRPRARAGGVPLSEPQRNRCLRSSQLHPTRTLGRARPVALRRGRGRDGCSRPCPACDSTRDGARRPSRCPLRRHSSFSLQVLCPLRLIASAALNAVAILISDSCTARFRERFCCIRPALQQKCPRIPAPPVLGSVFVASGPPCSRNTFRFRRHSPPDLPTARRRHPYVRPYYPRPCAGRGRGGP